MATVVFNPISIQKKLVKGVVTQSRFEKFTYNAANTRYQIAKAIALEDFDEHPVTKEIQDEFGKSVYLNRGNIFSFLGFFRNSKPIDDLRLNINNGFKLFKTPKFKQNKQKITYSYKVAAPSLKELYEVTPMPDNWSTKGWLQAIEEGIGSFASYVWNSIAFVNTRSKSGQALQIEDAGSGDNDVLHIPYVSVILKKFIDKFSKS